GVARYCRAPPAPAVRLEVCAAARRSCSPSPPFARVLQGGESSARARLDVGRSLWDRRLSDHDIFSEQPELYGAFPIGGNESLNVAPPPSVSSTQMRPPNAPINSFAMASPSPAPGVCSLLRQKASNIDSRSISATPSP